ncbi:MAG TPA: sugar phosphate nucleotidyltransferase, partial [Victivallales bacterium]|nr:sugar phosphate nucleotidyltransferase [Victivallales bacterium]
MIKPTLLVLAAGMGTRYGGLKQIEPIGPAGEIILDYSIYDAISAGFGKVIFVIRKDIENDFKETIGKRTEKLIETEYVFQELNLLPSGFSCPEKRLKPWGTGHAILCAKDLIKGPFAVINADDFYGRRGYKKLVEKLSSDSIAAMNIPEYYMVGFILKNTLSEYGHVSRGICKVFNDGYLINVVERTKVFMKNSSIKYTDENGDEHFLTGDEIVSMNMWGFKPSIFNFLEKKFTLFLKENINDLKSEFFIPGVIDELVKESLI